MTTGQMLAVLQSEGWHVTSRMIGHAANLGILPVAARAGNWRRWTDRHLRAMRHYLRRHSRQNQPRVGGAK